MRLIVAGIALWALTITGSLAGLGAGQAHELSTAAKVSQERFTWGSQTPGDQRDGRFIFRYDTFGDEQLWTSVLRMHEVLPTVDPTTALAVGLKIDVDALTHDMERRWRRGLLDLTDPALTLELLRIDAVVGLKAKVNNRRELLTVGVTCALCHSSVDDSLGKGVGRRLDGWANTELNVGAIAALSPAFDEATKAEFMTWGPGKYDPRHHAFDGTNLLILNTPTVPVVIPPIYGLKGVGFETYTGDGVISYWNSYVGVSQMGGQGTFRDPRIGVFIAQSPDRVTPKLAALLDYQLSLRPPEPPSHTFDREAARRGRRVFEGRGRCSTCHQGPLLTDVRSGFDRRVPFLHDAEETGVDRRYADRSATGQYRTTPLRALFQHAPYFHDGSAPNLRAVVEHYVNRFALKLTDRQKADLVEYLKSL